MGAGLALRQRLSYRGGALGDARPARGGGRAPRGGARAGPALGAGRPKRYADLLNNLATYYANIDEHAKAEPLLLEAIEIDRRIFGPDHPQLAIGLQQPRQLDPLPGPAPEAEPYYREALAIGRQVFGPDHPHVGPFAENLATLLDDLAPVRRGRALLSRRAPHPDLDARPEPTPASRCSGATLR